MRCAEAFLGSASGLFEENANNIQISVLARPVPTLCTHDGGALPTPFEVGGVLIFVQADENLWSSEYKWNAQDDLICGNSDIHIPEVIDGLKWWRMRFALVPERTRFSTVGSFRSVVTKSAVCWISCSTKVKNVRKRRASRRRGSKRPWTSCSLSERPSFCDLKRSYLAY